MKQFDVKKKVKALVDAFCLTLSAEAEPAPNAVKQADVKKTWSIAICLILAAAATLAPQDAMAVVLPTAGSFGFDIYDTLVNKMVKGPIGIAASVGALAYGGYETAKGAYYVGVPAVLGGVVALNADSIIASTGAII